MCVTGPIHISESTEVTFQKEVLNCSSIQFWITKKNCTHIRVTWLQLFMQFWIKHIVGMTHSCVWYDPSHTRVDPGVFNFILCPNLNQKKKWLICLIHMWHVTYQYTRVDEGDLPRGFELFSHPILNLKRILGMPFSCVWHDPHYNTLQHTATRWNKFQGDLPRGFELFLHPILN